MYSADARQGRSKAQRFDVISKGEALLNIPLACTAGRRRSHLIGFPECYLCSRKSLRGFNVSLFEWARGSFLFAAVRRHPQGFGHGVSAAFGWPMEISWLLQPRPLGAVKQGLRLI